MLSYHMALLKHTFPKYEASMYQCAQDSQGSSSINIDNTDNIYPSIGKPNDTDLYEGC